MLLNRMTLFLELVFSTELIREEIYFQPFFREHTLPGEQWQKATAAFALFDSGPFLQMQRYLPWWEEAEIYQCFDLLLFENCCVFTARLLQAQKFLWKIPVPQHWTYFWENFTRMVWHFSSWQLGGVISVLKNLEMLIVQINSVSLKICYYQ